MNITNFSFYAAFTHLNDFFGIVLPEEDFETIGLNAWAHIGNRRSRWYKLTEDTIDCRIDLPCNADIIESVHSSMEDYQKTDNVFRENHTKLTTEAYIESRNTIQNLAYQRGKLLNFHREENTLVFDKNYKSVTIVYRGIIADDEGLPFLNRKEMEAVATYCAYVHLYKKALQTKDSITLQFSKDLKSSWEKACLQARTPERITQNEMDDILDVSTRWDRKRYGMSYKPILK